VIGDNNVGQSLTIRRHRDGGVSIQGEPPAVHTFSARWIARHLGDLCDVEIVLKTSNGPVRYRMSGFEPIVDSDGSPAFEADGETPRFNFTGWQAVLDAGPV
jgi:hypothetical protein